MQRYAGKDRDPPTKYTEPVTENRAVASWVKRKTIKWSSTAVTESDPPTQALLTTYFFPHHAAPSI